MAASGHARRAAGRRAAARWSSWTTASTPWPPSWPPGAGAAIEVAARAAGSTSPRPTLSDEVAVRRSCATCWPTAGAGLRRLLPRRTSPRGRLPAGRLGARPPRRTPARSKAPSPRAVAAAPPAPTVGAVHLVTAPQDARIVDQGLPPLRGPPARRPRGAAGAVRGQPAARARPAPPLPAQGRSPCWWRSWPTCRPRCSSGVAALVPEELADEVVAEYGDYYGFVTVRHPAVRGRRGARGDVRGPPVGHAGPLPGRPAHPGHLPGHEGGRRGHGRSPW